jgi:hypothetical protein
MTNFARRLYSKQETAERRRKFKAMLKRSSHFGPRVNAERSLLAA